MVFIWILADHANNTQSPSATALTIHITLLTQR